MPAFPTFRLPFLAAKDVVNHMDLGEITALFLCSKKTQDFIKSLRKSVSFASLSLEQKNSLNFLETIGIIREDKPAANKFIKEHVREFEINISDDIGFLITVRFNQQAPYWDYLLFQIYVKRIDQQDQYKGIIRNLKICDLEIPVVMTGKYVIYTFWDCTQDGVEKIGEYLRSVSNEFTLNITVRKERAFSEDLRIALNWMNSTDQLPKYCTIFDTPCDKSNENDFKFILDTVDPIEKLDIRARLGDEFQHNTNFKTEYLYLLHSNWFTIENLLNTDCEIIYLGESKLTNEDLNKYLEKWMEGKFSKLDDLHVEMQKDVDIDIILSGVEDLPNHKITTWTNNYARIERNDGNAAGIQTSEKIFKMNVWCKK